MSHPYVAEAAVIGESDIEWGQRVVAVVRLVSSVGAEAVDELRAHCRAALAAYKVPREFRMMEAPLPRTASGKVRRGVLRSL